MARDERGQILRSEQDALRRMNDADYGTDTSFVPGHYAVNADREQVPQVQGSRPLPEHGLAAGHAALNGAESLPTPAEQPFDPAASTDTRIH